MIYFYKFNFIEINFLVCVFFKWKNPGSTHNWDTATPRAIYLPVYPSFLKVNNLARKTSDNLLITCINFSIPTFQKNLNLLKLTKSDF